MVKHIAFPGVVVLVVSTSTLAQVSLQAVEVTATQQDQSPSLQATPAVGSRLGLTVRETPASAEVITQEMMERRGARTFEEALRGSVGMTAGGAPGSPSAASTRGFTGSFITYLFDGDRVAVASMVSRPQDTWNYERIELLKGPASVLYGEGAIGAAVNFVTKRPDRNNPGAEAMQSYGSFGTARTGVGLGVNVGESSAFRLDYSHQQTDGHVDRNKQRYDNLTMGFTTALTRDLTFDLTMDYANDSARSYQGTPLVPRTYALQPTDIVSDSTGRVVDRSIAFRNYNVDDAQMSAHSLWTRTKLTWQIAPEWKLRNELSYYTADRAWRNSESYAFAAPQRIVRDLVGITHDHQILTDRLDLTNTSSIAGMKNRFVAGLEYTKTDFSSNRDFSNGSTAANNALSVGEFATFPGSYAAFAANPALYAGAGNRSIFNAQIPTSSLFLEDALSVSDRWTIVGGLRQDYVKLDRQNLDLNTRALTSFTQKYKPTSGRLGVVFAIDPDTSVYAQYTNASAPVGTGNLLLLSAANGAFSLSKGRQLEVGLKQSAFDRRLDYTVAAYKIELDNVLSRDFSNSTLTVNSGKQSAHGIEFAAAWKATRDLTLSGNLAWVDAQFDQLIEAGNVSRAGNTPPNVPKTVANLWADYKVPGWPVRVGAGVNRTGYSYANNANTLRMNGFTTATAYATWTLPKGELTFRVRNLTDKLYAYWSGANANNQVMVGAPRSFEVSYRAAF
ncbi:TonB-dependent siderophore receptor [Variovorax sp. LjRoot290]|uniref:TonB-dependent receptor n=1 Tax=Variovorax sp. LjRoot290 TaxID=3342316 RepID=UPI003ECC235B